MFRIILKKPFFAVLITVVSLISVYCLAAFSKIPFLSDARILWIETAMTTSNHQWLAEKIFPKFVIEDVMSSQFSKTNKISGTDSITVPFAKIPAQERKSRVGEKDFNGNVIIVDDTEQDITITEVKSITYKGRLIFVSDPSRVVVTTTNDRIKGQYLAEICQSADGIAAVNGNGGSGEIIGWTVSGGKEWGSGDKSFYTSVGFDTSNRLIVGNLEDFEAYNIRDLVQFVPALIVDGKQLVTGSSGWGIHPRTAIGQTADGTVILAVIDGRQIGHSIGITVGELADIFMSYGAVNAGMCDGGTSSVMCYNGEIIGTPAAWWASETGDTLPNAFVVLRK